ncbi:recombinase family protein [Pseudoduganella sp. FT55W]|uniref:Recombinase family protein n=1 Tax=Duganella rivi TaxID=2666083 RepID=A0A7X4KAL7_9BURK|nr:recombinase family protein [Duganella rivi]MYM65408.1 recombinase family protein [Duganella rivi]
MSKGQTVGYVRVSSVGQNTVRQLDGIELDETFTDKCSGSDTNRPELKRMLTHVRKGDTVVVHEISRLARNTADLLSLVQQLTEKGVTITFHKEQLTFTGDKDNPVNKMMLTMLGAVSAFELAMINDRRAEGQAKARAAGKHMGRSAKLNKETQDKLRKEAAVPGANKAKLAEDYGISRATLYAILKAA